MGTQIGKLIIQSRHKINYLDLSGKKIGIDAHNMIYAFLAPIRSKQTGGGYLTDSEGNVTSHLSGLFYRITNLLPYNIKPVFIFDGKPPKFKEKEIEIRKKRKKEATIKQEEAIERGDMIAAMKYAQATTKITPNMIEDAKKLLEYFGIPIVQAEAEAEAQGAFLVQKEILYAMASQDYDSFLFGSPIVIRNLTITRQRKVSSGGKSIELIPERVKFKELLEELHLNNKNQLILLGLLVGTDYNPKGIKGIGPKTALKLIHKYRTPENLFEFLNANYNLDEVFLHPPLALLEYFRNPEVNKDIDIKIKKPNFSKITEFLTEERDFNKDRIKNQLERMLSQKNKLKQKVDQQSLDKFF